MSYNTDLFTFLMEQLQKIPRQVEGILHTLYALREDLFDDNIGFVRKKIRQVKQGESDGSFSNLNNYLVSVQRIAENCKANWEHKGRTEDGYVRLNQEMTSLSESLNPVISAHREHAEEIRKVIAAMKLRLTEFLKVFITHEEEKKLQKRDPKTPPKKSKTPPPQQGKIPRNPEQRVLRAFDRMDEELGRGTTNDSSSADQ